MELLPFQIKGQITLIFTCIDITEDCVLYLYDKLHEKDCFFKEIIRNEWMNKSYD